MKVIGQGLGLVLTVSVAAGVANCGGKTNGDAVGGVEASGGAFGLGGGSSGVGGSVAFGGGTLHLPSGGASVVTTTITPRTPTVHRAQASSCVGVHSPPEPSSSISTSSACKSHADCTAGTNGKCVGGTGSAWFYYSCTYDQCGTDADCSPGMVCYCSESAAARCLPSGNCQMDADCGGGSYSFCSPSMGFDCGGVHSIAGYYCHTSADTCLDNADCTGEDYCNFDIYDGRWECTTPNNGCVIG